ncbi:MAG: PilZ domain-containing protein [Phycisphaerales bacterium]|nr:PilZ domain-containing protein [Phycisphaerales bacterium]
MSQWHAFARIQEEDGMAEAREHPRFVAKSFNCEKGVVTDFSASGLRIIYKKCQKFTKGDVIHLELFSPKGQHNCSATVMWINHQSRKHYEVGFRFINPAMAKKMRIFEFGFDSLSSGILGN